MHLHTASSSSKARPLRVRILYYLPLAKFTLKPHSADAHGDVLRGLQVVESAVAITSNLLGEKLEGLCIA